MSFERNDPRIQPHNTFQGNSFNGGVYPSRPLNAFQGNQFAENNALNQPPLGAIANQNVPNPFTSTTERLAQLHRAFDALQLYIKAKHVMENMSAGDWYQNAMQGFFCQAQHYAPQTPKVIYDEIKSWDTTGFPQGVMEIYSFVETVAQELFTQEHN